MEPSAQRRMHSRLLLAAKLAGMLLVVAAVVFLGRRVPLEELIGWLTQEVDAMGPWGPAAFAGLFIVATVCFLPASPIILACGAALGPLVGVAAVVVATLMSATISFLSSRYLIHDRVLIYIQRHPPVNAVYHALGGREGWKLVLAVRLSHALPFGLQNMLFGVSSIRLVPFLLATSLGNLPTTVLYIYLGRLGADALRQGQVGGANWAVRGVGLVVAVFAVWYVTRVGRRVIREKMQAAEVQRDSDGNLPPAA